MNPLFYLQKSVVVLKCNVRLLVLTLNVVLQSCALQPHEADVGGDTEHWEDLPTKAPKEGGKGQPREKQGRCRLVGLQSIGKTSLLRLLMKEGKVNPERSKVGLGWLAYRCRVVYFRCIILRGYNVSNTVAGNR